MFTITAPATRHVRSESAGGQLEKLHDKCRRCFPVTPEPARLWECLPITRQAAISAGRCGLNAIPALPHQPNPSTSSAYPHTGTVGRKYVNACLRPLPLTESHARSGQCMRQYCSGWLSQGPRRFVRRRNQQVSSFRPENRFHRADGQHNLYTAHRDQSSAVRRFGTSLTMRAGTT